MEEITHNRLEEVSSLEEERGRREKYFGRKSLTSYLWCAQEKFEAMTSPYQALIHLAKLGDEFQKEAMYYAISEIARQMNLVVKNRNQISDYRRRIAPRIRIGKYSYYLVSK